MANVTLNYLKSGLFVVLICGAAWLASLWARAWPAELTGGSARLVMFLAATVLLLTAGIGRLGWEIQTWGGGTPPESLDQWIFLVLSLLGTVLLVFEYLVGRAAK
jgi:hypothetical protein